MVAQEHQTQRGAAEHQDGPRSPWVQGLRHPIRAWQNAWVRLAALGPTRAPAEPDLKAHYLAAVRWIEKHSAASGGILVAHDSIQSYPEVTGYLIPTLLEWGERERAVGFARWLLSVQNTDGSWSDAAGMSPYTFDTGQILKGLLAIAPSVPEADAAIRRGCEWLLTQIQPTGRITTPDKAHWALPDGGTISENIHLYALAPLREAGRRFGEPRYIEAVSRALAHYLAQPDLTDFNTLSHFHAYVLEALIDLGHAGVASRGMAAVERLQRRDGSVPAHPNARWVCATGLAQYAVIWYRLGKREQAARAFHHLCGLQNPSGGFFGGYGPGVNYFPRSEISWGVKYFLDAYFWHIRTAFDAEVASFPDRIEPGDGRVEAVARGLGDLTDRRVLDVGCGKGRFSRALLAHCPSADYWGTDLSTGMLRCVPAFIQTRQGSMLNLPFPDASFDAVFCVEALEHVLNPPAAIRELCRVLKPGGRLSIVDKNREQLGTMRIEAWEQWFDDDEMRGWLTQHCKDVQSEFVPWGTTNRLFIAWSGTRAGGAA